MNRFNEQYEEMLRAAKSEEDYHDNVVNVKKSRRRTKKERTLERKAARRAKRRWQGE